MPINSLLKSFPCLFISTIQPRSNSMFNGPFSCYCRRNRNAEGNVDPEEESRRKLGGIWPHNMSPMFALLAGTLGLFNVSRFALLSIEYGGMLFYSVGLNADEWDLINCLIVWIYQATLLSSLCCSLFYSGSRCSAFTLVSDNSSVPTSSTCGGYHLYSRYYQDIFNK